MSHLGPLQFVPTYAKGNVILEVDATFVVTEDSTLEPNNLSDGTYIVSFSSAGYLGRSHPARCSRWIMVCLDVNWQSSYEPIASAPSNAVSLCTTYGTPQIVLLATRLANYVSASFTAHLLN